MMKSGNGNEANSKPLRILCINEIRDHAVFSLYMCPLPGFCNCGIGVHAVSGYFFKSLFPANLYRITRGAPSENEQMGNGAFEEVCFQGEDCKVEPFGGFLALFLRVSQGTVGPMDVESLFSQRTMYASDASKSSSRKK